MNLRAVIAFSMGLSACAGVTPAPRLAAHDPTDPHAAEAPPPVPSDLLRTDAPVAGTPSPQHDGAADTHAAPDAHGANGTHVCPMHASAHADHPGACPVCGMALVERARPKPQGSERP